MAMASSLASRTVRLSPVTAPRRFATPSPRRSRRCPRSCGDRLPGTRAPRWPSTPSSASTPGSTSSSATRRALGSEGRTRTPTGSCGSTSRREPTCPGTPAVTSTPLRSRSTQGRARPSPGRLPPRPSTSFFYARPDTAALRRPLEPGLGALVRVDYCPVARVALADGHAERVGDQRRVLGRVDRPADHSPGEQVEHDGAVHLAFPGGVLGDVGDPEPVWVLPSEVPVDEVAGGGLVGDAPVLRATRQAPAGRPCASATTRLPRRR